MAKTKKQGEAKEEAQDKGPRRPTPAGYAPRLRKQYQEDVVPKLKKEFGIENGMAVPRLEKIVINSHEAAGEIWVASRAGGYHFRPQPDGGWLDGRSGSTLTALLSDQLSRQAGLPVDLGDLPLVS